MVNLNVGGGTGISVLVVGCSWLYWVIRKKRLIERKANLFKQNGGIILQQQLSDLDDSAEKPQIFTIENLKNATNNFKEIVSKGRFGKVYKGVLPGNKIVVIKKFLVVEQSRLEQFIEELIALSQINQRNVVKLLGCCLETELPLMVYEFITNGTLFRGIHEIGKLSWEIRLRIAKEIAEMLSYLHSKDRIIHRDVKSTNILLDDQFTAKVSLDDQLTAKVSDLGVSRTGLLDKTQLSKVVQEGLDYLDPECLHTGQLSDKSDVYSFGVILAELLTSRVTRSSDEHVPENERLLSKIFISSINEKGLSSIQDHRIVNDGNIEQVREVTNLALCCLKSKGNERPTMSKVLEELMEVGKNLLTSPEGNPKEPELHPGKSLDGSSTSTAVEYDSPSNQAIVPFESYGER